jgi:hypothetical protein
MAITDASGHAVVRTLRHSGPVWKLTLAQGDPIYTYTKSAAINAITFSPNQSVLAIAPADRLAFIVDPVTGQDGRRLPDTAAKVFTTQ